MKLTNVRCKWAKLSKPDEMSGSWTIDLCVAAPQMAELEAHGFTSFKEVDGEFFVTAKRKPITSKGTAIDPPRVVDLNKRPFTGQIGNGSTVNAIVSVYDWKFKGKTGKGLWLEAVQVVDVKEYAGREDFDAVDVPVSDEAF
jgi:hypothetical protein